MKHPSVKLYASEYKLTSNIGSHLNIAALMIYTWDNIWKVNFSDPIYFYSTFLIKCIEGCVSSIKSRSHYSVD